MTVPYWIAWKRAHPEPTDKAGKTGTLATLIAELDQLLTGADASVKSQKQQLYFSGGYTDLMELIRYGYELSDGRSKLTFPADSDGNHSLGPIEGEEALQAKFMSPELDDLRGRLMAAWKIVIALHWD